MNCPNFNGGCCEKSSCCSFFKFCKQSFFGGGCGCRQKPDCGCRQKPDCGCFKPDCCRPERPVCPPPCCRPERPVCPPPCCCKCKPVCPFNDGFKPLGPDYGAYYTQESKAQHGCAPFGGCHRIQNDCGCGRGRNW